MAVRFLWFSLMVLLCSMFTVAREVSSTVFASNPMPSPGQFLNPSMLTINPANSRFYILDSGLKRIVSITPDGQQAAEWPLESFGINAQLSVDALLPNPVLAVGGGTVYLLKLDQSSRQVDLLVVEGNGRSHTINLPVGAEHGAVTVDATGHLLFAYIQTNGGNAEFTLARENDAGEMKTIATLENPCSNQVSNLTLTGFATAPDGRFMVGIAQKSSNSSYMYTRSWLIQGGEKNGIVIPSPRVLQSFSLLDGQGKVQERFRAAVTMAGQRGYPPKPCVPLFTSLTFAFDGQIISGGHANDPFLRVYSPAGALLRSVNRLATGGQQVAVLLSKKSTRLFAIDVAEHRIAEYTSDGRVIGRIGTVAPYDLSHPMSIAADSKDVYTVTQTNGQYHLLRFATDGKFYWSQQILPPHNMMQAKPYIALTSSDRICVGWRMPKAVGVGWVDVIMSDGTYGMPLWSECYAGSADAKALPCSTPIITGMNGYVYVLRELKGGARVHAYSSAGAFLQLFPVTVKGVTAVTESGNLAWARSDNTGMVIVPFTPQGANLGWKRVPRPASNATLLPAQTKGLWGWLSSSGSLLEFDDNLTVVDELFVYGPDGHSLKTVTAIAGDGNRKIYLAVSGQILVLEP